ncbi:hypothetical protein ACFYY8_09710 [Streptosporangium sp. NPDC001559]|uniref:hypothetical protein n=1 Tax=Streptosporangium sp. NPDC001559 TaxID=3366187 RepID=UPI0036E2F53B
MAVNGYGRGANQNQTSHANLIDRLVERASLAAFGPDLALLTYAVPDDFPYKTVSTYLNTVTGGKAHSVALSGQGLGAPFTALRVASAYERTGQSLRSLVAVVECATPADADRPEPAEVDSGVLLAFDGQPGTGVVDTVYLFDRPQELASRLAELVPESGRLLVVLGPGGDPAVVPDSGSDLHRAAAGSYCTSVWLALARHWAVWEGVYPVVALCDTDPVSGTSHLAVLRNPGDGVRHRDGGAAARTATAI